MVRLVTVEKEDGVEEEEIWDTGWEEGKRRIGL